MITETAHLDATHYAMLTQDSGLSDAVIAARGYRTSTGYSELKSLGIALPRSADAHGLLLPLHTVEGKPATWVDIKADRVVPLTIYRPDTPLVTDDGSTRKYLYPKGVSMRLDCSPLCQPSLDDPAVSLWLTEGQRKGDALVTHDACALALLGVWNFRGTNAKGGKTMLTDWQYVTLQGRDVRVVYDSDVMEKAGVAQALDALVTFLVGKGARVHVAYLPSVGGAKVGVDDYLLQHSLTDLEGLLTAPGRKYVKTQAPQRNGKHGDAGGAPRPTWQEAYTRTKGGEARETFANLVLALQHLPPWDTQCWYDVVRELPMCGTEALSDAMVGRAALALEQTADIPIRTLRLVLAALVQHCRAKSRDVLQEWLSTLPSWDETPRLTEWLCDHAGAPKTAYGMDISRLLPVSMVARALQPGCQYRNVVIFEGDEDLGKSKLVKALASPEWYRELSLGLEGKEAHMIVQGAWLSEFAELSSLGRTGTARLKSFITMETDDYVPKFANAPVSRPRRTVFVGTVNPEGDGTYLPGQTGNTRFLPIQVADIHVDAILAIREQLFAEALVYYRAHPDDWWQLSSDGQAEAVQEREARRQRSVYEDSLRAWLQGKIETTWEEIAQHYLLLEAKEKWKDKGLQMEVAKALRALGWRRKQQWIDGGNVKVWVPGSAKS
jgi:putative DNA primase/helicase